MFRHIFAALSLLLLPNTVFGAPVQLISDLPSSYAPGQLISFDVYLPAMSNLGSYNIDLVLASNVGTAGVDYFFDAVATSPATTHYVFRSTANYFDAVTIDSATRHRITLTDFDVSGVNVVAGTNDQVATVFFRTLPTFQGPLSAFVDSSLLILDTPDVTPTPVAGFSSLQSDIGAAGAVQVLPVPEPSTLITIAVVLNTILLARPQRRRDASIVTF